jgi:hypothetical protein
MFIFGCRPRRESPPAKIAPTITPPLCIDEGETLPLEDLLDEDTLPSSSSRAPVPSSSSSKFDVVELSDFDSEPEEIVPRRRVEDEEEEESNLPPLTSAQDIRSHLRKRKRHNISSDVVASERALIFDIEDGDEDWQGSKWAQVESQKKRLLRTKELERRRSEKAIAEAFDVEVGSADPIIKRLLKPIKKQRQSKRAKRELFGPGPSTSTTTGSGADGNESSASSTSSPPPAVIGQVASEEEKMCAICLSSPRTHGVLHAVKEGEILGEVHQVFCQICCGLYIKDFTKKCPICREDIEAFVRIFNS